MFQYEEGFSPVNDKKRTALMDILYSCRELTDFVKAINTFKQYGITAVRRSAFMNVEGQGLPDFIWDHMSPNVRWYKLENIYREIAKKRLNGEKL